MEITKEELMAYTDAAVKTATALEKIADRLIDIAASQKECQIKTCDVIVKTVEDNRRVIGSIDKKSDGLCSDMLWMKWIWTSFAAVLTIGWAVIKVIEHLH